MRSLLGAVAHMHKEGVIHRDLKPENILMTDRDNPGSIKVADFGLSKGFRREDEPEERRMTQFCGTMAFMVRGFGLGKRPFPTPPPPPGTGAVPRPPILQQACGRVELWRHRVPTAHRKAPLPLDGPRGAA